MGRDPDGGHPACRARVADSVGGLAARYSEQLQENDYFEKHPCYNGLRDLGDSTCAVIEQYLDGTTIEDFRPRHLRVVKARDIGLDPEESALVSLLRSWRIKRARKAA